MMATVAAQFFTAIALWCGSPSTYMRSIGSDNNKKEVQLCREKLLECHKGWYLDNLRINPKCMIQEKL